VKNFSPPNHKAIIVPNRIENIAKKHAKIAKNFKKYQKMHTFILPILPNHYILTP